MEIAEWILLNGDSWVGGGGEGKSVISFKSVPNILNYQHYSLF